MSTASGVRSTLFQKTVLIIAPVLFAASSFFWKDGEYGATGGTLLILSLFFWIPALSALFGLVKYLMPRYAQWGYLIALFGCISGMNFAALGYYAEVFNISHDEYLLALAKYPVSSGILLFWAGPLFPISIVVLSFVLWRTRSAATWACLCLALAGVAFPVSRIPRVPWLAHMADFFFLLPMIGIAVRYPSCKKDLSV